jgi:transcriptional antiterminator RfaH
MHAQESAREAWFCLRSQPKREQTAADHLRQRVGIEVFAPQIPLREGSRGTGIRRLRQPLFPGYLFARFKYPQQLRHVVSTRGVNGILRFGSTPPIVADDVIDFLRREVRLAEGGAPVQIFREGETVKIVNGCFRQVEGRVLSSDSASVRVRVLLSLLGREIQVSVLAEQLVSTEATTSAYPSRLRVESRDAAPVAR